MLTISNIEEDRTLLEGRAIDMQSLDRRTGETLPHTNL